MALLKMDFKIFCESNLYESWTEALRGFMKINSYRNPNEQFAKQYV